MWYLVGEGLAPFPNPPRARIGSYQLKELNAIFYGLNLDEDFLPGFTFFRLISKLSTIPSIRTRIMVWFLDPALVPVSPLEKTQLCPEEPPPSGITPLSNHLWHCCKTAAKLRRALL